MTGMSGLSKLNKTAKASKKVEFMETIKEMDKDSSSGSDSEYNPIVDLPPIKETSRNKAKVMAIDSVIDYSPYLDEENSRTRWYKYY